MRSSNVKLLLIFGVGKLTDCVILFPNISVLQLSWCLVVPLELPFPNPSFAYGRIGFNQGFQINYNMPYTLTEFTNPNYWALRTFNRNFWQLLEMYKPVINNNNNRNATNNSDVKRRDKRDLSAGQLYSIIENTLEVQGYNRECLKKSICELAKDPLYRFDANDLDHERDLFLDIIHFILTPSIHDAFDTGELEERKFYEEAELIGHNDGDCNKFYTQCKSSPLEIITHRIEESE